MKPDLEAFVFAGEETIDLILEKQTRFITLHSKDLEIESAEIIWPSTPTPPNPPFPLRQGFGGQAGRGGIKNNWAINISYDEKAETATFSFQEPLPKGKARLKLTFKGLLNDYMRGFYRSRYKHGDKQKHLATTQFEATDARRAFPCFDEPAKKAVFEVSLILPQQLTAISNTLPVDIAEHQGGYKIVRFAPTPKMSTYLLAMIVGDFEFVEKKTSPNPSLVRLRQGSGGSTTRRGIKEERVKVRVYTTPGKKHQARFALRCAVRMLKFYNHYFDIPYPLDTLDLIAIPDFAHGAMENWGAITSREAALLIDEEHSSASSRQQVALTIAHELAHQWFGNLVTMQWWTHLWLNEGFASYLEYLAVDHLFPSWDIWTQFAYNDMGEALKLDGFENTHPIEVEVHHPEEIGEIFDAISYSKGASVIRMLAAFLGEQDFRNGLRYYLKKYAFGNASTTHLWQALEKVSGKPVGQIMKNWTSRPGYPLVKIQDSGQNLKISQTRFYLGSLPKNRAGEKTTWNIPMTVHGSHRRLKKFILSRPKVFHRRQKRRKGWLKFNSGETGFFRVAYSKEMLNRLVAPIKSKQLKALDRWGIIRDSFALAEAGKISVVEALRLAQNYAKETDYTVWVEIISGLDLVARLLHGQKIHRQYQNFSQTILLNILSKVNWQPKAKELHTKTLLRSLILNAAGKFGHRKTIQTAQTKFQKLFSKEQPIHPDIRSAVYNLAAENGGLKEYQQLQRLYAKAKLSEEQRRLGRAMANFKNCVEIKKYLKFALSKQVRAQDAPLYLAAALSNPHAQNLAWAFIRQNWKILLERYGQGGHLLNRIIQPLWHYHDEERAREIKRFFKIHPAPGCQRTISQVLEKIRSNAAWLKRDLKALEDFLA
jgi:puromycin-sensitive aminopeptidase